MDVDKVAKGEQQAAAEDSIQGNPAIDKLIQAFDAQVADGSVKPIDRQTRH
jgi:hypothetical protein